MIGQPVGREAWGTRSLVAALAIYAVCAAALYPQIYVDTIAGYSRHSETMLALGAMILFSKALGVRWLSPARAREVLKGDWTRPVLVVAAFCVGMAAYTTLKLAIPAHMPFYLDRILADADLWLHGANPGDILHGVLPDWMAGPIVVLYGPVWFFLLVTVPLYVAVLDDEGLRHRYFWSVILSFVLLGTFFATLLSSVGPIFYGRFYGDDRFAALVQAIHEGAAGERIRSYADYLHTALVRGENRFGSGISAMPSVHLMVVTINAWMLTNVSRWAGLVAWLYVVAILAGSVYLGWHYALDGYVSILATSLIWWIGGRLQRA